MNFHQDIQMIHNPGLYFVNYVSLLVFQMQIVLIGVIHVNSLFSYCEIIYHNITFDDLITRQ